MTGRRKIRIAILWLLFSLLADGLWAADWGFRGLLPRGTGYYDKTSIKKIGNNISRVWTVTLLNEKGRNDAFSILQRKNKAPTSPEMLNQESTLLEIDCEKGQFRIVAYNIYDKNENLILSIEEVTDAAWHDIVAGSVNEKLKTIVCNTVETVKKDSK